LSGSENTPEDARRALALPRAMIAVAAAVLLVATTVGCGDRTPGEDLPPWKEMALSQLQTRASLWWAGDGRYAILQAVGKDEKPVVTAWDRTTGKLLTYPDYRVVGVEPHEARFWIVPDSRPLPYGTHGAVVPHVMDIAGDGVDSPPAELYAVRLDEDATPRSDVDARWHTWSGSAAYSVSVEIDVNRGACPSSLRFSATGTSRNAWSAKVPTDVVTFEPIGWSPSGLYFAVITAADASATAEVVAGSLAAWERALEDADALARAKGDQPVDVRTPPPPTWEADILVFTAADGSLARRQKVRVPVLEQNAGANLAAWSTADDVLLYFEQPNVRPVLGALMPSGYLDMIDPFARSSAQAPRFAWFVGADEGGPLVARMADGGGPEGDIGIWRLGDGPSPEEIGPATGSVTARWSPQGGMLSLEGREPDAWNVHLAKTVGGAPVKVFSVSRR
jgi:hypothetical protein